MSDVPEGFRETPLGLLPETWQVVRLGKVLRQWIEKVEVQPGEQYTRLGVRWYAEGPFKKDTALGDEIKSKYLYRVEPEAFVYNRLFGWKGSFGVIGKDMGGCFVSSEFPLFRVADEIAETRYLWRWFSQSSVWKQIEDRSIGSTRTSRLRLKVADLLAMQVPLPPLAEQRAIVHVLGTVQRAWEATEGVLAAVRELKRSLMRHLFTYGPVPVHEAERVELQEAEIGEIPAHWDVVSLASVCAVRGGKRLPKGHSFSQESTLFPYIRVTDFANWSIDRRELRYLTHKDREKLRRYIITAEDVYISIAGTIGVVGTVPKELSGANLTENAARIVIEDKRRLGKRFLVGFLASGKGQEQIDLRTTKTSQPKLALSRIRQIPIPLPPLIEQCKIARMLGSVDAKIAVEETRRDALDELFHSLLHHLMTGKIRALGF